jgi:hypothetical protein
MTNSKETKISVATKNLLKKNKDTKNLNTCLENNEQSNNHILEEMEEIEVYKTHLIIV